MHLAFDRGTVVLDDVPAGLLVAQLPGITWDPRVARWRAPARYHDRIVASLAGRGVRVRDDCGRGADRRVAWWTEVPLRDYQQAALAAWSAAGQRGVVVLPTGAGKTRVALAAMRAAAVPVLCVAPTRILVEQWIASIRAFYGGAIGQLGDGKRDLQPITVATFASACRWMDRLGDRYPMIVVDEAHHVGTGLYEEILEMSTASARLGLTATLPGEAGQAGLDELIGPVVYRREVAELAGTALAPFELVTVPIVLTPDERERYASLRRRFSPAYAAFMRTVPMGTWVDFVAAAGRTEAGRLALAAWRDARELTASATGKHRALATLLARHPDRRVLVFTADNAAAYRIARDHLVMPITCDIKRAEREWALTAFRDGRLRTLVSARVLNEGVDVPDADVAIIVGAAQGQRELVQRVGRVLRPRDGKHAVIYELVVDEPAAMAAAQRRRSVLGG